MSRRSLSTRGMEPPRRVRPLLDVDTTLPHIDDPLRREMCQNSKKIRRITNRVICDAYMPPPHRITNKKFKLDEVNHVINPFKLAKLAYMSCSDKEKQEYDKMQTPKIDVQICCYLLKDRPSDAMIEAMRNKHLECFKHAHKMGAELPRWSCYNAIACESVEILQYCYENNCDFVEDLALKESAINGYLPCLEYTHKIGGLLTDDVMQSVVAYGNLDCLKYLLQNGCKWTSNMCALSANSGDLDFVKFCQNNGCPWAVIEPSQWYVLVANLSLFSNERDEKVVDLVKRMKKCVRYIERTAKVEERCKLKNYVGVSLLSITL